MKILLISLVLSQATFATCMMTSKVCSPKTRFENTYIIKKVSCSPPGGPVNTSTRFEISNPLAGSKPLVSKKFNVTKDRYFQAKIESVGKAYFLSIDDRSLETQTNINISTDISNPKELHGYHCKDFFQ